MLKSTKILLITAGVLVGLGLIIAGIAMGISRFKYGGVVNMYDSANDSAEYVRQTMDIKEHIDSLEVSEVSSDINILPSDRDMVYAEYTDGPDYMNEIEVDGNTLKIRFKNRVPWYHKVGWFNIGSFFGGSSHEIEPVDIYLPSAAYDEVKLTTTSGNITVAGGLECDELSMVAVSGEIKAENIKADDKVSIDATSGEIDLKNTETGGLDVNTVSGSITTESVKARKTDIDTTSGDITLDGFDCEDTEIDTTSGDIRIYAVGDVNVSVDTVSGDVDIENNSPSGHPMNIDTTSGDVTVRKK